MQAKTLKETLHTQPPISSISVFFPCYNEEENLPYIYQSASAVLKGLNLDYEIIFVDDGSTDATFKVATAIAELDPRTMVIHHPKNFGYGAALRSGFNAASKEVVFYTDCDRQFDLNDLPCLLPLMRNYDIVSCFRLLRQDGILRDFNSWCWNKLIRLLFRLKVKDVNCAFKVYRRDILEKIVMRSNGASINIEILFQAHRCGFAITQVGVHHFPRVYGRPTGARARVILRAFFDMFKLWIACKG